MKMNQKILVTGGTRGLGAAAASLLKDRGAEVWITGRQSPEKSDPKLHFLPCDFEDLDQTDEFLKKISDLELTGVVNNAGINVVGRVETYSRTEFSRVQRVNLEVPFAISQAVIPGMRARKYGRIVNIGSVFGTVTKEGRAAYSASKAGLLGFTRALAVEVARDNILVNVVAPGFVDTELTRQVLGDAGIAEMLKKVPIGRLANSEEIARVISFFLSAENTFITGQQILVDGGFTCE
jgi:NAD(P)-dependent dehydrogenase (short-subunit alcohol dehydrogenase family)